MLVAACSKVQGVDSGETFVPVIRLSALWQMLAIVEFEDLLFHKKDAKTAFLNEVLLKDVCMKRRKGCVSQENPAHVCKLQILLYDLKRSRRQLFSKLSTFSCKEHHFQSCTYDRCAYVLRKNEEVKVAFLHVGYLLITRISLQFVVEVKTGLGPHLNKKNFGEAKLCIEVEISRNCFAPTLNIGQENYTSKYCPNSEQKIAI